MCTWGTNAKINLANGKSVMVDSCLVPILKALNEAGINSVASCCGHGKRPGNIALADGRELVLVNSHAEGRRLDGLIDSHFVRPPADWQGEICKRCLRANVVGFVVEDRVWADVASSYQVLCPACFDEIARAAKIPYRFLELYPVSWNTFYGMF